MRVVHLLALASLASAQLTASYSDLKSGYKGPEIWGSYNEIEDCEMDQAIECLHEIFCKRRNIPYHGKIRCTINKSVAYICNYRGVKDMIEPHHVKAKFKGIKEEPAGGELVCDAEELYEAWRQIRIAKGSQTGWWHDAKYKLTLGFDRRCPDHECDNGWKRGSEGEQCTNIKKGKHDWTFDYEAYVYANYTGKYERVMPEPTDNTQPVDFNPWVEAQRPK
ncbi:hypothetical protein QBC35DRAFT_448664 [Podospora australis]|uniref:Secreted protein n=1 Tax=Podospora australis TaxID=1536484 RepID=A0AAN7ALF6_9PEZI|nr:hypothetical protein QBC35DRAFT_448664 [Podospora australis]